MSQDFWDANLESSNNPELELKELLEGIRARLEKARNEFQKTLEEVMSDEWEGNGLEKWLFGDSAAFDRRREEELRKQEEYYKAQKAMQTLYSDDPDKQKAAMSLFGSLKNGNNPDNEDEPANGFVGEMVDGMSEELSEGLTKMLTDFENFETNFKNLGKNLANEMLKITVDSLMEIIVKERLAAAAIAAIRATYGFAKAIGTGVSGFFNATKVGTALTSAVQTIIPSHHSGGIIPEGANMNIPGTDEQLALLKGGERVLSPAENVQYDRNSAGSNVVFNNFNIKAWDSRDVQKYLLDNKDLLNAITYQGIKDNNHMLRHMVRNA